MKKLIAVTVAVFFASATLALAGPHPHGPFTHHKSSGKVAGAHHNPNKPGPGSFHTANVHPGPKQG
jgi:hypothetical protein